MADTFQPIGAVAVNPPIFQRYSKVARGIARRLARRIVERQLQAEGALIPHVPYAKVRELAQAYLEAHQELLDRATEIVRTHPKLSKMAEVVERNRERQERKWRKQLGCNGVLDRPVCTTDNARSGTEKTQLFSTTSAIFSGSRLLEQNPIRLRRILHF
jgi:hypothetical protein